MRVEQHAYENCHVAQSGCRLRPIQGPADAVGFVDLLNTLLSWNMLQCRTSPGERIALKTVAHLMREAGIRFPVDFKSTF
ncbi:MAG: hypothetical protein C7B46_08105 [Sulfobacillus benefaciens]|uniref:Uncharacterized protein n=1 Tax=Sulfobacillus benefaciens TaxID=453960 RepID=A0A2T2XH23_9FIRM|nr:MAG: hypothetical protein C7B46_08105 [Sulfobacillus benefaciens]